MIPPTDWMERARCQGKTELFFDDREASRDKAKAICRYCPVKPECAKWCWSSPDSIAYGVYAGTDEDERKRMTSILGTGTPYSRIEIAVSMTLDRSA